MDLRIFNLYWWKDFYYTQISSRIWPRQKWLTKKIPRTWQDKDTIMELVILECIKNYVEGEGALEHYESSQADPSYPEEQKEFDREVFSNYKLITVRIPELESELKEAWDKVPHRELDDVNKGDYIFVYGEIDKIEEQLVETKTSIMLWAVKNRGKIWT